MYKHFTDYRGYDITIVDIMDNRNRRRTLEEHIFSMYRGHWSDIERRK